MAWCGVAKFNTIPIPTRIVLETPWVLYPCRTLLIVAFIALKKVVICYLIQIIYVHIWMEEHVDLHKKCAKKRKKGGASPKAQPQSEGYTSLALLKPPCSSKNISDIKEDRGAHSNYIAYF